MIQVTWLRPKVKGARGCPFPETAIKLGGFMAQTITLDKHEMVIDREDFERLKRSHAELLGALKALDEYAQKRIGNHGPINMWTKVRNAIAKAEGK